MAARGARGHLVNMKRRTFLLAGLGAGGALFLGWSLTPPRQRLRGRHAPETGPGTIALNGWLTIGADDTITVVCPKAEMGQGIHTALAMLVAEELDCDWARVQVTHAPVDAIYHNIAAIVDGLPFHPDLDDRALVRGVRWLTAKTMREVGVNMTGGSSSVRDVWQVAREAGATARAALLAAAAAKAQVDVSACRTERGVVVCGERRFRYGELSADALAHQPARITLKRPEEFTLIGTSIARLDSHDKVHGAPLFGIDVALSGQVDAAVLMPPTLGSRPLRYSREAAMQRPGVRAVVELAGSRYGDPPAVAVIADSWWQARQALAALDVQWSVSPHAALSTPGIMATLRMAAAGHDGLPFRSDGDARAAVASAAQVIRATYEAPYLAHATMEPMNATVLVHDGRAELWTGTQVPTFARAAVAMVLDIDEEQVTLHQRMLGGGFGRRLEADYVAQATAIARAMPGVPVQTLWTREDDLRHDFYRPAAVSQLEAGLDANGRVTGLVSHSASQAPFKALSRRVGLVYTMHIPDKTTAEGTWDQPYEFPALRAAHAEVELPVPVGSWRSVGHSHQGFFFETFIDELAHAVPQDPLAFRLSLLQRHPRAAAVLQLAAEKAGWGSALPPAADGQPRARGLALHWSFGTVVAQVAEVSLAADRRIRVHRVVSAVDCGLVVNPRGVAQQVESSVIYGLSAALYGEVAIDAGRIRPGNFDGYRLLRFDECPVLETHLVPSAEVPSGVGEPALPPVAPAVGNALFALTGVRVRSLPLRAAGEEVTT